MFIQSLERAIKILNFFTLSQTSMGIVEMSKRMDLSKATVHGLVKTLEHYGFLRQDPETRKYSLGFKIYELGSILQSTLEINQKASNPAQSLANRTKLDVRLSIWHENSVLFTMGVYGSEIRFFRKVGPRLPAYCCAHGRAFLAFFEPDDLKLYLNTIELKPYTPYTITNLDILMHELEKIPERGYATDREELYLGIAAIGAPIFNSKGIPEAAISIAGSPDQILGKEENRIAGELLKTAMYISRELGYIPEEKSS